MLRSAARDLSRFHRITRIIGKHGFGDRTSRSGGTGPATDPGAAALPGPRRFRLMLEELGPTFIKFGQVLSARPDLVSRAYVEELKHLQDTCEPLPFAEIEEAILAGLGRPPGDLFASIDPRPLATASIAQVHRGVTREGRAVVVKVQRPGIAEEVRRDIGVFYHLARLLDAVVEESALAEPVGIVRELERALEQELSFLQEAANIREFARLHAGRDDIVIPGVHDALSSTTVLTLDLLEGVPFSRIPPDADRRAIAERIVREAFDEVFVDGVFHADPHPGNLMYLGPGRYGILDFGLLGRLSPEMRETLVVLALAVSVRDADTIARTLYRLGQPDERVDLAEVRRDTVAVLERYLGRSIASVDSGLMVQELLGLGVKHRLRIPAEYTMLGRAAATIEGIVRELCPDLDVAAVARPYAERLLMQRVAPGGVEGGMYRTLLQLRGLSDDLPVQLSQIVADVSSGRLGVTVAGPQLERLASSMLMAATMLSGAILGGAFVIGSFIGLAQSRWTILGVPVVGVLGGILGLTLMVWVLAYALVRPRLRKISLLRLLSSRR